MKPYKNLSGQSNVVAYQLGTDYIVVQFTSGSWTFYKYTYVSAGQYAIEAMKKLAEDGLGLNSYIASKGTQPAYEKKVIR